jgi:nucleoside-diphosphate kinase
MSAARRTGTLQRATEYTLTTLFWMAWLYLIMPLLSLMLWAAGVHFFVDEMLVRGGYEALLREHYAHIKDKSFYPGVENFMMSSPVVAMCLEGIEVVEAVRILVGITKARAADAGSIRGDLAMSHSCNVIHASDSVENGAKEVERFFNPEELFEYRKSEYEHVYNEEERGGMM